MKKFKISFLAVIAIVLGFAASSFTVQPSPKDPTKQWFHYKGQGLMTTPGNYEPNVGDPDCQSTDVLCGVYVIPDANDSSVPDGDALDALYEINNFTEPIEGQVELRDAE